MEPGAEVTREVGIITSRDVLFALDGKAAAFRFQNLASVSAFKHLKTLFLSKDIRAQKQQNSYLDTNVKCKHQVSFRSH